jgi:hypothetical protein
MAKYTRRDVKDFISSGEEIPVYLPPDLLSDLLTTVKSDIISSSERSIFVVTFEDAVPKHFHLHKGEPNRGNNDKFSKDVVIAWDNYIVGKTIPVIMCRLKPTAFTGLMITGIPWAGIDKYCLRCGAISHEIAACTHGV